jgi:hypothetical protein
MPLNRAIKNSFVIIFHPYHKAPRKGAFFCEQNMAAELITLPFRPVINTRGVLEPGALLDVFEAGTTTRISVFSDSDLSAALSNPVVANSSGVFPSVYWDNVQAVRVRVRESDGTVLGDADPYFSDGLSSTDLSFLQSGTGAQTRTVQAKLRDTVAVADYTNEATALAAAGTRPVLYSDGSERLTDSTWAPAQTAGIVGSLRAKDYTQANRTGGYGVYGASIMDLLVSAPSNGSGEFDVGITSWASHTNLSNNNSVFGSWAGANTPGSALNDFSGNPLASQTYASGSAIGTEINAGNRWADFGLLLDIGVTRYTVGAQIVPDVIPSPDGVTPQVYPGSFGLVFAPSIHGHKWWTGEFVRENTIMPNGIVMHHVGGSSAPNAPADWARVRGFYVDGLDFTGAAISGEAIHFAPGHEISWTGATITGGAKGIAISIGAGSTASAADDFQVYVNNFGNRVIQAHYAGSAPRIGFLDAVPSAKVTVNAAATDAATTQSLVNQLRGALITFGLCV